MNELTYFGKNNPLVETFDFEPRIVTESVEVLGDGQVIQEEAGAKTNGKRMVLEGIFQLADKMNLNKRVYPLKLWERLLNEKSGCMRRMKERAMVGHLEHPEDGATDLNKGAILVTGLKLKENGEVWGQLVVLNTPAGKIVQEYVDAKVKIGISSRGTGSVDSKGVVQEDYEVSTWDIVFNPSTPGAHPKMENANEPAATNESALPLSAPAPANDTIIPAEAAKGGESRTPVLTVTAQILNAGVEGIRARTGLSTPNDLANALTRVLSHANQHGELSTVEAVWTDLLKIDPKFPSMKHEDAAPAAAVPAVEEKKEVAAPAAPAAAAVEPPKAEEAAPKDDAVKLLDEAKVELTRLTEANTKLAEQVSKMTADTEASAAIIVELRTKVQSLQAMCDEKDKAVAKSNRAIAALTSVDSAAQVREAVEEAVRKDARLADHRKVLESSPTPAAVEAQAVKLLDTLGESAKKTIVEPKVVTTLESRIRQRTRLLEDKGLPAEGKGLKSDETAETVVVESVTQSANHKGAALVAAAIPKLHR